MIQPLADALAARGYDTLTDVQQAVSAPELAEADLLVSAQTGSGKTVGFGLAIAPTVLRTAKRFAPAAAPLALIVAPTRELALQVQRELQWLYAETGARIASCIGGMDARQERRALERGAHIVVGTPGRLCDHLNRGALELQDIRAVVLDEADEMLDLGFRDDLELLLDAAPEERRTLLFSATVPMAIAELAKTFQRDAVRIKTAGPGKQHADIAYQVIQTAPQDGEHAIINLLLFHDAPNAIVFANTRAAVARLTARLANRGFPVVSLSGELSQDERTHALQAMRDGRARVCVATDVAARGIDLPALELVIHADLPTNTEALLHRSGRTGRAGRKGTSALIVSDKLSKKAARLLKWAKIEAEWTFAPDRDTILAQDESRLLAHGMWQEAPSEREAAFAARLLDAYGPNQIAAACLRLFQAGRGAPEDLNRHTPGERPQRASFGPSRWISVSVGKSKGAEPRWLLPLLCRAGNLEKQQIGKIKVQFKETFVEIAEDAVATFEAALDDGMLEEGLSARLLDGNPDLGPAKKPSPYKPGGGFKGKPARKGSAPEKRTDASAPPRPKSKPEGKKPRKPKQAAKTSESTGQKRPKHAKSGPRKPYAPRGGDAVPFRKR